MMLGRYTEGGVLRVAKGLGVDVPAIKAVIAVESNGTGFLSDGRPRILFEAHRFSEDTAGAFDASHPTLSSPEWNRALYIGGAGEYQRLYQAVQLNGEAAVRSSSWGLMQCMGFNWRACGEKSIHGFMLAMHHNEDAHLALAGKFIASKGLAAALRDHDWAAFALGYNGRGYKANRYDEKLAQAFAIARRSA